MQSWPGITAGSQNMRKYNLALLGEWLSNVVDVGKIDVGGKRQLAQPQAHEESRDQRPANARDIVEGTIA